MTTKAFWVATAERAARAFAWAVISVLGAVDVVDAFHADWLDAFGVGLGAAVLSVLASIAGSRLNDPESPSLVDLDRPAR